MAAGLTTITSAEVEAAIRAVLLNQSYAINGRTYTRADLQALTDLLEITLKSEAASSDEGGRGATIRFGGAE